MPCEPTELAMKEVISRGYLPRVLRLERGKSRQRQTTSGENAKRSEMALPLRKRIGKGVWRRGHLRRKP